ncbi:MAG: glycoside hydrolase family 127 protein [Anaerotruncus sp.]|nr:glycoside hydrolase family 127 protein [Anaerotruncus sp.]
MVYLSLRRAHEAERPARPRHRPVHHRRPVPQPAAAAGAIAPAATPAPPDYPIRPVPFTEVTLADSFWAPRLETNRTVSIPYALRMIEETGRVDNFRKAARLMDGPYLGRRFNDSDVYKAMEAAAYALRLRPDPALEKTLDDLIALIARAQEPDGYLFTTRTNDPAHPAPGSGPERWSNLRVSHELYNVGHMYEAAVAHFQATGKRTFLAIAEKNAALLLRTFGTGPGQRRGFPGHQEIEIGLAKLYRATGDRAYLDLAKFFLDERGHYFGGERHAPDDPFAVYDSDEYMQNHKPVLEQDEAVGHAVRAMYMYSGMADVAALGGYPEYVAAIDRLWLDVAGRKQYLTGGVGARSGSEAFGEAYELPNAEAYTETCAAIGNALWNYRLFLLHGESKYMDAFERVLYNGLLSGVSLSGDRFFYQNPLESAGGYARSPWFEVACCPANMTRFLPSLPGYVYATKGDVLFVNLFIAGTGSFSVGGRAVTIAQATEYPWDGLIGLTVSADRPFLSSSPCESRAGPGARPCPRTSTRSWAPPSTRPSSRSTGSRSRPTSWTATLASAANGRTATASSSPSPCRSAASSPTKRSPRTAAASPSSAARSSTRRRGSITPTGSSTWFSPTTRRSAWNSGATS